jgi:hypothetical protein
MATFKASKAGPSVDEYRAALRECAKQMGRVNVDEHFTQVRKAAEALAEQNQKEENDDGR